MCFWQNGEISDTANWTFRWSGRAAYHLEQIRKFIEVDNDNATAETIEKVITTAQRLETFPELGRRQSEPGIRELIHGSYLIIYRIVDDVSSFEAVFHSKRKH